MKHFIFLFVMLFALNVSAQEYTIKCYCKQGSPILCTTLTIAERRIDYVLVDTGCSAVQLTYDDYVYLKAKGLISEKDFIRDAATHNSEKKTVMKKKYRLKDLIVGNMKLHDVTVLFDMNKDNDTRLLGMSVFTRFSEVTIDMKEKIIRLKL